MSSLGIRASELRVGRRREAARLLPGAAPGLLLAALAAQVLLPVYVPLLGLLDLVLLTVVYLALLQVVALVPVGTSDDVDGDAVETDVQLVQVLGGGSYLVRQHLVDLVLQQIALRRPQLEELFYRCEPLFDGLLPDEQRRDRRAGFAGGVRLGADSDPGLGRSSR